MIKNNQNIRVNRRDNQERTIQRQRATLGPQDEDNQNNRKKIITQNILKDDNTGPSK